MAFNHSFFTSAKNMKIVHFVLKSCTFRFRDYMMFQLFYRLLSRNSLSAAPAADIASSARPYWCTAADSASASH